MYRAYALLGPKSSLSLATLQERLRDEFPNASLTLRGRQITVSQGEWDFEFLENEGPEVLAESADMAEKLAGHEDAADLEACGRRIEMWSETPDPMLEYFERYQAVIGLMKAIPGVIVVDPKEPSFL